MSRYHRYRRMPIRKWKALRRRTFERDGYRCVKCGRAGRLECDHVRPYRRGGNDDLGNLQTLCRNCHIAKTAGEAEKPNPARDRWRAFVGELQNAR